MGDVTDEDYAYGLQQQRKLDEQAEQKEREENHEQH